MVRPARFVFSLLMAVPLSAQAQADLIQTLLARIDKLEKRVAELESKAVPTPLVQGAPHDREAPAGAASFPSMRLTGFTDLNFSATDQRGAKSGFYEGQFILHISSALSSKVSYFGELSVAARTDAGTGSPAAPGFNFE